MKYPIVALTLQAVILATCHAQLVYPDEFESLKREEEKRNPGKLVNPAFQPTVQSINDVESPAYGVSFNSGGFGFQQMLPPRQTVSMGSSALPQSSYGPPASLFDTFLPPRWRDHVVNIISNGVTKFSLDMDRAIENTNPVGHENLLFSPISLTITLAMVLLASAGKTFEEVAKILSLDSGVDISNHSEIVHQIFGLLIQESDRIQMFDKTAPQCKFAFGIFVEDGYPIREQFKAISEKVYKSEIINVDFSNHSKHAQTLINNWVDNRTNGKIKNMLNDPPNPLTDVIITSALYFSGEWEQHFMQGSTRRKAFNVEPDEVVYVDMMYNGGWFPFYEDKNLGLKIIGFPYKGLQVTMYAILPLTPGAAALKQIKNRLTPEIIDGLVENMKNSSCIVAYPRMKLSNTLKLQSALEALGLRSLFDPLTADLSVLSPGRGGKVNATQPPKGNRYDDAYNGPSQPSVKTFFSDFNFPARFNGPRSSYYRYEDKGYEVEQWHNGYKIKNVSQNRRAKRQSRPIDQEFVNFLNSQKLPSFGIDELRNSAGIRNPGLFADDVIHKVEMTVNEKGTEASAATSVVLDRTGDYKRFIANRPFIFFIKHDSTKIIWFWGTINRPVPFYTTL